MGGLRNRYIRRGQSSWHSRRCRLAHCLMLRDNVFAGITAERTEQRNYYEHKPMMDEQSILLIY